VRVGTFRESPGSLSYETRFIEGGPEFYENRKTRKGPCGGRGVSTGVKFLRKRRCRILGFRAAQTHSVFVPPKLVLSHRGALLTVLGKPALHYRAEFSMSHHVTYSSNSGSLRTPGRRFPTVSLYLGVLDSPPEVDVYETGSGSVASEQQPAAPLWTVQPGSTE
jgi:hypothetical protein